MEPDQITETSETSSVTVPAEPKPQVQYVQQPAPAVTDSSKPLITLILVLLVVLIGIVFFSLGNGGGKGLFGSGGNDYDPELEALRAQRAALGGGSGGNSGLSSEALAVRISDDAIVLGDLVNKYSSSLAATQSEADNLKRVNESLHDQVADFRSQLAELRSKLSESSLDSALKDRLQKQLDDARKLYQDARDQLAKSPSIADYDQLLTENQRLRVQLAEAPNQSELIRLENENIELKRQLAALRSKTNRSRLFAESSDALSVNGRRLYSRLSNLEGRSNSERLETYENIKSELNVRLVDTVAFGTGVSSVPEDKALEIRQALQSTGSRSEYLVVGYASLSGDAASNRELSAKRATSVATIADLQRSTQTVKAVFMGQTNRFSTSSASANQICEIWEILPQ